ncbi:hypothetical protein EKG37_01650 [Robertmurraya yapensis]|uniref:Transcriptional regulator n=2 Tax=Bacillaceae TaxID=186817 RepID=A0A3S0IIV9_9BACI|nr:hypothetical protein [Bacillus yapensis]RTR36289.1 hypothetical protein EKG37_01650 [Bacillus yapensis]TKT05792.1 hypothetical protein FAR12_01650 [Bacillus yapensis]
MKNPWLMCLCVLYIQKGLDPHTLSERYGVADAQISQQLNLLIEIKVVSKISIEYHYICPGELSIKIGV